MKTTTQHRIELLISQEQIAQRVVELGEQIRKDYGDQNILLVGVLKGAAVFLADLLRAISGDVDYDFVAISSYGNGTRSSGVVRILKDLDESPVGRHVLIVEDIVDTGLTLQFLLENMKVHRTASVKVCALVDKVARRLVHVPIDYRGFEVPDVFVVGYGMDYAGLYRNLPYIGTLVEEPAF
ncbi:MAG: hypoxanthine phosphoribosyltransferase [Armatimonadota bacterium]|nr:hypoxanthine phosphoribosyltransferase [Armatimonadota bacterium]MDW8103941.1 hypoxanthine phosphoribosyltransferase [Armatimonadota bacterium]MDW8290529.1 hypoxanthine phosphoribosyltransferase [Armatimonadota bacterium]